MHFPLHPDTPPEGVSLAELFAGRDVDLDASHARMKALMDAEGLPYAKRTHSYNSRLAQELGKWAETQDGGDALHDALYAAYFVAGRNIGDLAVLADVAADAGFSGSAARGALEERRFRDAVDQDWALSRAMGVTGVPTYAAAGYGVVGAQPYETLAALVRRAGAAERPGGAGAI